MKEIIKTQIHLPVDLRRQVKAKCALTDQTMKEVVINLLTEWVERGE